MLSRIYVFPVKGSGRLPSVVTNSDGTECELRPRTPPPARLAATCRRSRPSPEARLELSDERAGLTQPEQDLLQHARPTATNLTTENATLRVVLPVRFPATLVPIS